MTGGGLLPLNGTTIAYTTQGPEDGIPFLLIHGWTCDQTDWLFQTALLALTQAFFVIAMDLRGHGRSFCPPSTTAFDFSTMASDAAALLKHLGVTSDNQAIVMAHSLGGGVLTELVAAHPHLIRGHVLVDPAYTLTPEILEETTKALEEDFDATSAEFFNSTTVSGTPDWIPEWHKLRAWVADEKIMMAAFKQMGPALGPSGSEYLKSKKVDGIPRLVADSTKAGVEVEKGAGIDPKFDTVQLMEVGHWIMQTAPEQFNSLLGNWLKHWGLLSKNDTTLTGHFALIPRL